jgi:hypothetical protein
LPSGSAWFFSSPATMARIASIVRRISVTRSLLTDSAPSRKAQEAAGALDGVHQAEDQAQRGLVVRGLLQPDQSGVEVGQRLVRLGQEVSEKIVHAHVPLPGRSTKGASAPRVATMPQRRLRNS